MSRIFCLHFLPLRPGFRVPPPRGGSSLQLPPAPPASSCPNRTGPRCASRGRSTPGRTRAPVPPRGSSTFARLLGTLCRGTNPRRCLPAASASLREWRGGDFAGVLLGQGVPLRPAMTSTRTKPVQKYRSKQGFAPQPSKAGPGQGRPDLGPGPGHKAFSFPALPNIPGDPGGEGTAVGDSRDGLIPGRPDGQTDSKAVPWTEPKSLSHAGESGPGDAGCCRPPPTPAGRTCGNARLSSLSAPASQGPNAEAVGEEKPRNPCWAMQRNSPFRLLDNGGIQFCHKGVVDGPRAQPRNAPRTPPRAGGMRAPFPTASPPKQGAGAEGRSNALEMRSRQNAGQEHHKPRQAASPPPGGISGLAGGGTVPGRTKRAAAARILGLGAGRQRAQGVRGRKAGEHVPLVSNLQLPTRG